VQIIPSVFQFIVVVSAQMGAYQLITKERIAAAVRIFLPSPCPSFMCYPLRRGARGCGFEQAHSTNIATTWIVVT
jgi:hypothetical protein